MTLRVLIERREHDREDDFDVVTDQVAEIFVVPEIECSLGDLRLVLIIYHPSEDPMDTDLEVGTGNGLGQLVKQWLLNLSEFGGVHNLKDVLNFVKEHHLLRTINFGPIS